MAPKCHPPYLGQLAGAALGPRAACGRTRRQQGAEAGGAEKAAGHLLRRRAVSRGDTHHRRFHVPAPLLEPEAESNSDPLGGKRVLPVVIERKTPSDLTASLNEGRYDSQIHKMVASEIALKVYLVEGDLSKVTLEQHDHLDKLAAVQGFHVIYTKNGWKTALTLGQIARLLNEAVKSGAISPASLPTMDEVGWRIVWGVRAAAAAVAEGVAAAEEEREAAAAEEVVDAKAKVTNIAGAVTTRRRTEAVASRSQPALPTVCRASCSW